MNRGYIYLAFAALSYASMGALIKALSTDLQPFTQTFLRLIISMLLTFALVVIKRKRLLLKKREDYYLMLVMGIVGYGLQIIFYTFSLYYTTIGTAIFIFSSYPILTSLFAALFLKEKLTKRTTVAILLLVCVLFLLFNPDHLFDHFLGNSFALISSVTFVIYVLCSRYMSKHGNDPETVTLYSVALAVITSGAAAFSTEHVSLHLPIQTIAFLIIFGFLNAAAFNLVNKGFQTVKAGIGTMILLLEPPIGALFGILLFHEVPTITFILGASIMVITIYIATFRLD